ncbi:MAG: CBS domain-containing protein [Desulfobulbaceae bacterium]|nr:CBS domain-containing protein [Desulfobulbaceae bacterium]
MGYQDEIREAVRWDYTSVDFDDNLQKVIRKIIDDNVSALAVKREGVVVGVVSDMDVVKYLVEKKDPDSIRIAEIMTPCKLITSQPERVPCIQLHQSETVENALRLLDGAGLGSLLVSGDDAEQVGMVSIRDLLRLL